PRGAPPARRAERRAAGREVHRLPDAQRAAAGPDPGPGGRAGEGHHRARGDRGGRSGCRRARARRAGRRQRVGVHDLVPAGSEVRRRDGGDPAQHDRRARPRAAARAAPGQGDPVQRAARQGARGGDRAMNLELTDEQSFLREAAREALSRVKTVAAARDALEDPTALPDLWPTACEAGWTGLLVSEERGGAGLGPFDAMLVAQECGRVLASVPIFGHLLATYVLDRAGHESVGALA